MRGNSAAQQNAAPLRALVGEAGVGKSRLLREFARVAASEGALVLESGSIAYGSGTAFRPGIEILRCYFKVSYLAGRAEAARELAREALHLAVTRKERGNQAYALWLLGEIAAREGPAGRGRSEDHLRRAMSLADELGMRPMRARCLLALGLVTHDAGQRAEAREILSQARTLLHDLAMTFWLATADTALARVRLTSSRS